ncbi:MAG: hypothetical protein K0R57_6083 [Paenibacillaceae bacterium]|nr:hypothetical protein [Paenibacillaceae bacterium]
MIEKPEPQKDMELLEDNALMSSAMDQTVLMESSNYDKIFEK